MGRTSGAHGPGLALLRWSEHRDDPRVSLSPQPGRVWPLRQLRKMLTREGKHQQRLRAQHLGERVAVAFLRAAGDTEVARLGGTSIPFDVMSREHACEVKSGLVTNQGNSCQWRCSLSAAKGAAAVALDAMDDGARDEYWEYARSQMMTRKYTALAEVQKVVPVQPITLGLIVDLEGPAVDVFWFEGWRLRIGWTSPEAKAGYRGTFRIHEVNDERRDQEARSGQGIRIHS